MIPFDDTETLDRNALTRDVIARIRAGEGARAPQTAPPLRDGGPLTPPPAAPATDQTPRRHDVVRWDHDGAVTKTQHPDKDAALAFAHGLHWATTWKWAVMLRGEFIERQELEAPSDYPAAVAAFDRHHAI